MKKIILFSLISCLIFAGCDYGSDYRSASYQLPHYYSDYTLDRQNEVPPWPDIVYRPVEPRSYRNYVPFEEGGVGTSLLRPDIRPGGNIGPDIFNLQPGRGQGGDIGLRLPR